MEKSKLIMTESEQLLKYIEKLFRPIIIKGAGINFGPPNKSIAMDKKDLLECEMLSIDNYKGYEIRVIIKKIK